MKLSLQIVLIVGLIALAKGRIECPDGHHFAYYNGEYCCKYNQEKIYGNDESCDGGEISISSTCCKDDAHVRCGQAVSSNGIKAICFDHWKAWK